ncbi:MAG: isoleucine--tRNA ligase, partial [Patescibacteria group bacterium]
MPYDANKNELEILKFWQDNHIFEKSVSERPENKPYVFYDGPPFATGLPHYGHILSSVIKDVVPRYWTMKGYRVRRRWGWDCHGLPIESLIEKELNISGKKDIEEKIGVTGFNDACRSKVLMYTQEWKKMVDRIGRWVEFDTAYKTMDPTYMESVWWALKNIWEKGLIYEGRKVLMYCTRCETPVSKAEIAMDNSYKDITEETATVKFRLQLSDSRLQQLTDSRSPKSEVYLLAWTTTPWTLPGNVALAVGKNIEYSIFTVRSSFRRGLKGGEMMMEPGVYILASDRYSFYFKEGDYHSGDIIKVKGTDLVGLEYEPLFDIPAVKETGKKAHYVTATDFVTTDEGTGIVHTAVIYGEDDYNLGLKIDLPMVPLLDEKGHFNESAPEFIRGEYLKKAEKAIKTDLEQRGLLFARTQNTHSYPHCWRCETPLIYNAVSSWFINIQKVKERMITLNERVNWFPEHLKNGRFLNIMKEAPDWNISRNRYWATALPFWKSDDGDLICVGSMKELEALSGQKVEDLHKDVVDKIIIEKNGKTYRRVPEVLDSWVEAASMPFAEWHYPFENKETFESRFPGQYIAEYIAQTRTWFYYMHAVAVLLFDDISFENVVCTGTILNDKGEKLSKSKRNFTDPWIIIEQYGMDALR